jgi:ascorbate-specific PTS system EIIC-type component UlaA
MHPIIKSTIQTVIGFMLIVAIAYMNRGKIDRYNERLECRYCQQAHK